MKNLILFLINVFAKIKTWWQNKLGNVSMEQDGSVLCIMKYENNPLVIQMIPMGSTGLSSVRNTIDSKKFRPMSDKEIWKFCRKFSFNKNFQKTFIINPGKSDGATIVQASDYMELKDILVNEADLVTNISNIFYGKRIIKENFINKFFYVFVIL